MRPRFRNAGLVMAAAALWPASGAAQTDEERLIERLDLQTLLNTPVDVWTPSKAAQNRYQAPSIITTVTREQIQVWGYRTVAELLDHLLGFYVVDDHTSPNLVVRGTSGGLYSDSSIVKVLINGHPVAFSPTGGVGLGPELIPLSAIERVEVIRGPVSALYGADAFLGLINIQTREGPSVAGGTAWLSLGQVGQRLATDVDVSAGTARGMVEALVAFRRTHQDLSGLPLPDSSPAPNIPPYNRGARTASGLDQQSTSAIATVTLRPRERSEVGFFAHYLAMDRGAEFGSLLQLANGYNERNAFSENRVSQWQARAGLHWREEISSSLDLSVRAAFSEGGTGDDNRLEVGSEFYFVRRRLGFRGGDLDGHLEWTVTPTLVLAAGTSGFVDDEQLPSRIAIAKRPLPAEGVDRGQVIDAISASQGRKAFAGGGGYLHATWESSEGRLSLTGGLRYDRHNVYGGQLSRRIGLVASPRPELHLKLLHGTAFQAPSPFLLHAVAAATRDVVGNPHLRPQYVNTFEAQVQWEPRPALSVSTDVAYNLIDDKTEFIQQGINQIARNVAHTASVSWESQVELRFRQWLNGHLTCELRRTIAGTVLPGYAGQVIGQDESIAPRLLVHAGLAAQPGQLPLRAAVIVSYIGTRRASGTNILLNGSPYTLPPYTLLEVNLATSGFRIIRHADQEVSFSLNAKNVLGATGAVPGFSGVDYPLAPRALFLQMNLVM
jgi:outer membrane receptor for ferrienterochelin and colicins